MNKGLKSILVVLICVGVIGALGIQEQQNVIERKSVAVPSEDSSSKVYNINLGTKGLNNPEVPSNNTDKWGAGEGSYLYFGEYFQSSNIQKEPIKWRVLTIKGSSDESLVDSILLMSDNVLDVVNYSEEFVEQDGGFYRAYSDNKMDGALNPYNNYETSEIKQWLNTTFVQNAFSNVESGAINATRKNAVINGDVYNSPLNGDKVFIPSVMEMESAVYGFYKGSITDAFNRSRSLRVTDYVGSKGLTNTALQLISEGETEHSGVWQLRTSLKDNTDTIAYVKSGNIVYERIDKEKAGVVPSMNLNTSSVVYTSAVGMDKTKQLDVTEDMKDNNEWNIAIQSGTGFKANIPDDEMNVVEVGKNITINVSNIPSGTDYTQLSAMVVDDYDNIVAYGKISNNVKAGNVQVKIPKDMEEGFYTLKVFAEDVNSSVKRNCVDLVSNMIDLPIIVQPMGDTDNIIKEEKEAYHNLTAALYDNISHTGAKTNLTDTGVTVSNWRYDRSKFLMINIDMHASQNIHTVRIELSREMTFVGDITNVPIGCKDVKFEPNDNDIIANGDASKCELNPKTGTLIYYLKPNVTKVSIPVELRYDVTFWDRKSYSSIAPDGTDIVKVSLNYEEEKGTYLPQGVIKTLKVSKVTTGVEKPRAGYNVYQNDRFIGTASRAKDCILYLLCADQSIEQTYFKEGIFEINLPYWKDNRGQKIYLNCDVNNMVHHKAIFGGAVNYEIIENSESKIRIRIKDMYYKTGYFVFKLPFEAPNDIETTATKLQFANGNYSLKAINNAGDTITSFQYTITAEYFQVKDVEDVWMFTTGSKTVGVTNSKEHVSHMGGFFIENRGTLDSVPKTIDVSFPTNLLITTFNAPYNTEEEYIEITYGLKNDNGSTVTIDGKKQWTHKIKNSNYNSQITTENTFVTVSRQDLPVEHRKYYFTSINYTTKKFAAASKQFNNVEQWGYNSGGNFYGYLRSGISTGSSNASRLSITSKAGSGIGTLSNYAYTVAESTLSTAYGIDSVKFSKDIIEAGDSVELSGSLFTLTYPYGNIQTIKDIQLGFELPIGVSVEDIDTMTITNADGRNIKPQSLTSKSIGNGKKMWIVKIDPSYMIGYYNERLRPVEEGHRLNYTVVLKTEKDLELTSLFTDQIMWASAGNRNNSASGYYIWCVGDDTYDLNNNYRTSDKIAKVNSSYSAKCVINARTPRIDATDSVSVEGKGSVKGTFATTKNKNDIITYKVKLESDSNSTSNKCEYYIPIPKVDSGRDDKLVCNNEEDRFNFNLLEEAKITGNATVSVYYTTSKGQTYKTASENNSIWKSYKDVKASDVTMIKLVLSTVSNKKGMEVDVSLRMAYGGAEYLEEIGQKNVWKSYGSYEFFTNSKKVAGVVASSGCSTRLGYTDPEVENITLIATPNVSPTKVNVTKESFPDAEKNKTFTMPMYTKEQTYTISDIQVSNLTVKSSEYIKENQETMSQEEANKTFGFTLNTEGGNEIDVYNGVGKEIGGNKNGEVPKITLNMYYGSKFNDSLTNRSITITLTSNLGLNIIVEASVIFEDKNEVEILNGEMMVDLTDNSIIRLFYKYEYKDKVVINEPIKFKVIKSNPDTYSQFVLSKSSDYNNTSAYVDSRYLKLYNSEGKLVEPKDNVFDIKGDVVYTLYVNEDYIKQLEKGGAKLYVISHLPGKDASKKVRILRRSTFDMH
ncbi:MAG: hypothetical protein E7262_05575 [Lachnospiraceae bacterium]|nr:hypothetical protein [Lachnospiraceae bacterium]